MAAPGGRHSPIMGPWSLDPDPLSLPSNLVGKLSTASAGPRTDDYIGSPCLVPYGDLKPLVLGTLGERLAVLIWGIVRIIRFVGQFRLLVRPKGRAWLMLRPGPLDSWVWLLLGICYLYKARLRRKPSLATCRIDRLCGYQVMRIKISKRNDVHLISAVVIKMEMINLPSITVKIKHLPCDF